MARMAILVPYPELLEPMEGMLAEQPKLTRHSVVYLDAEEVADYVRGLEGEGCDIIMARGLYARIAREATKLPIVELRVTAQELGELVLEIKEELNLASCRIGLIGEPLMLCDTSAFPRLFQTEILRYELTRDRDSIESLRQAVHRAREDGCQAVIGGRTTCREAESMGFCHRFIHAGKESLSNAFDMARHIAYAIDQEKASRAEIETMLNFTSGGIVRVDRDGVVLWASELACELLNLSGERILQRRITEVFPALSRENLDKALDAGDEVFAIVLPPNRKETVVNISPVRVEGIITGAMLTFHEGRRIMEMNSELRQDLFARGYLANWRFDRLPAESAEAKKIYGKAKTVAKYRAPVLLLGPVGSGKEILAQCIHNAGVTQGNAFIPLDCRAYQSETLDTMLFGNYSSRKDTPSSLVEIAENGTIYLAHVDALSPEMQFKLMHLTRGYFMHNGSNRTVKVNVRLIASADTNLIALAEKGVFRSDLYYSFNALGIKTVPLSQRREDILGWTEIFLATWEKRYDRRVHLTQNARAFLEKYDWPGNLNEVYSVCEQIVLLSEHRSIDEGFLRRVLDQLTPRILPGTDQLVVYKDRKGEQIARLLRDHHGNRQKVADALGVSKTTLWRYMKKYGIDKDFSY